MFLSIYLLNLNNYYFSILITYHFHNKWISALIILATSDIRASKFYFFDFWRLELSEIYNGKMFYENHARGVNFRFVDTTIDSKGVFEIFNILMNRSDKN